MKYVAFSIATHGDFKDICCAVTVDSEKGTQFWYTKQEGGKPAVDMQLEDKAQLAAFLIKKDEEGYSIFGWDTQSYHLRHLYQETGIEPVKTLAKNHIDLQFDLLNNTGIKYPLAGVARWLGLYLDPNMSKEVPSLWNSDNIDNMRAVIKHVKAQVDVLVRLIETIYPKESENQLPLHIGFIDANGKEIKLPVNGLPVSFSAMAYSTVHKHALKPFYVEALDWIDVWKV